MKQMKYIALICARGGSKGLPRKNIKPFAGTPLIGWSINLAMDMSEISSTIVSTEDEEIAEVAKSFGADVPFVRPKELAEDSSNEWLVWQHAAKFIQEEKGGCDGIIVLPATAPLRSKNDVKNCILEYENSCPDLVITVTDAHRNPYFNMVKIDSSCTASPVIDNNQQITRRQNAPEVYDMATVAYILRPAHLFEATGLFQGSTKCVKVAKERSVDIDTYFDFEFAEFLASRI